MESNIEDEYGIFYAYGSWTDDESHGEETALAFCLKHELVEAIYSPLIKLWELFLENKKYDADGDEYYGWQIMLSDNVLESANDIIEHLRSEKIDKYLKLK